MNIFNFFRKREPELVPGSYHPVTGEWIDPIVERGFNVNPAGTIYDTPTGVPIGREDPTSKLKKI